jgi:hypothetical protein
MIFLNPLTLPDDFFGFTLESQAVPGEKYLNCRRCSKEMVGRLYH